MKKQLLFITALIMCVTQSFAQTFDAGAYSYTPIGTSSNASCKGFKDAGSAVATVVIPEKVTDPATSTEYTVVRVVPAAFYNNASGAHNNVIESISLPGSINSIAFNAFRNLENLTSLTFAPSNPEVTVLKIENFAFAGCSAITSINLTGTNVNLGHGDSGANKQGSNAFRDCTSLTSFTLQNSAKTTRIFTGVFRGCTSLETVDFSGTAISIFSPDSFNGCTALKNFYLGSDTAPVTVNGTAFAGITAPITGGQLFVPTAAGVTAYTDSAIFDWESYFTIATGTLGIDDLDLAANFKLFPNPAKNTISVSNNVVSAKIYSLLGTEVKTFINTKDFDISNLANGVYLFKAELENGATETVRFVKK